MKSTALILPALLAGADARYHHRQLHNLSPRDIVFLGPAGICPAFPITTVQLQPIYYSEYIPYNTIIDPFRNGHPITITNAPTTIITGDYLTSTIYPTPTSGQATIPGSSNNVQPTGPASSIIIPVSSTPSAPSIPASIGPPFGNTTTTQIATSALVISSATNNGQPTLASTGSAAVVSSFSVATASSQSAATATITGQVSPLTFGQGLPAGQVSNLDPGTFIFLAMASAGPQVKRDVEKRQQFAGAASASAAVVIDFNPALPPATPSAFNCDRATTYNLINGILSRGNTALNKVQGSTEAILGTVIDTSLITVSVTFSINNGFLRWNTPDVGSAVFYNCAGIVYAGFPNVRVGGCFQIVVGAVAGSACRDLVSLTRSVSSPFTNPFTQPSSMFQCLCTVYMLISLQLFLRYQRRV